MKKKIIYINFILAAMVVMMAGTALADIVEYSTTYKASGMVKALSINGYEPSEEGTYPVFVWICGTKMTPWSEDDQIIAEQMALRGFVTMSVDYSTLKKYPFNCSILSRTVQQIFDELDADSAVNVVAARAKADISKGIVVAGFSQGANIASLAKNYNESVEAAFVIGNGYQLWGATCYDDASTDLPSSRMRSIMGAYDDVFSEGGDPDANRIMMETTTGYSCGSTAFSCIDEDDSGWYLVQASETASGNDGHCFYSGDGFCGQVPLDAEFEFGTNWWSLGPSLDWLASFASGG